MCNGWSTPQESNGGLPVNVQDQTSPSVDLFFLMSLGSVTVNSTTSLKNSSIIQVVDPTGFAAGQTVGLFGGPGEFYFGKILMVNVDVLTIDTPLDIDFPAGSTVLNATDDMAVDGLSATKSFKIGPLNLSSAIDVDITRLLGYIESNGTQSDDKFGDLPPLNFGVVFRVNNGRTVNKWNVKTNGDIGLLCFDATYTPNAPAGNEGFRFRNTYAGQAKHGVVIRLLPGESLEILIQDDLRGLVKFNMMAQGHLVTD